MRRWLLWLFFQEVNNFKAGVDPSVSNDTTAGRNSLSIHTPIHPGPDKEDTLDFSVPDHPSML